MEEEPEEERGEAVLDDPPLSPLPLTPLLVELPAPPVALVEAPLLGAVGEEPPETTDVGDDTDDAKMGEDVEKGEDAEEVERGGRGVVLLPVEVVAVVTGEVGEETED